MLRTLLILTTISFSSLVFAESCRDLADNLRDKTVRIDRMITKLTSTFKYAKHANEHNYRNYVGLEGRVVRVPFGFAKTFSDQAQTAGEAVETLENFADNTLNELSRIAREVSYCN